MDRIGGRHSQHFANNLMRVYRCRCGGWHITVGPRDAEVCPSMSDGRPRYRRPRCHRQIAWSSAVADVRPSPSPRPSRCRRRTPCRHFAGAAPARRPRTGRSWGAEADALCGAGYGERSGERTNHRKSTSG
jgi:hypothetical protein